MTCISYILYHALSQDRQNILYNTVSDFSDAAKLKNNSSWLIKVAWLENR